MRAIDGGYHQAVQWSVDVLDRISGVDGHGLYPILAGWQSMGVVSRPDTSSYHVGDWYWGPPFILKGNKTVFEYESKRGGV